MIRIASLGVVAIVIVLQAHAWAGHEITFYPSFYPQEITVRTVDARVAAQMLAKNTLQAYVGADPFPKSGAPGHITYAESLGAVAVLTFNHASPTVASAGARCAAAAAVTRALAATKGDFVVHPYPITPFHADYLAHHDLVDAVAKKVEHESGGARPKIQAKGRWGEALARRGWALATSGGDATLDEVDISALLDHPAAPAWGKAGWRQAYLVYADAIADPAAKRAAEELFERRSTGMFSGVAESLTVERRLVAQLLRGCERVPIGYTIRREAVNVEYSAGVENVAYDAQRGLSSALFVRSVKLKDFPWNGWLTLGVESKAAAAWNPIAGFSDAGGRLLATALVDPALLPAPRSDTWIANRVRVASATPATSGAVTVPADALIPDVRSMTDRHGRAGTDVALRPVGPGVTAGARLVYRLLASKFHDDTKMGVADLLYPVLFAHRFSAKDPVVARTTAALRSELVALRIVRIDTEVLEFGDLQLIHDIPIVEVYLRHAIDPAYAAAVAPPWSAIPWELTVLMEEAVDRGYAAFSEPEAKRRGIAWLDLARDRKLHGQLVALATAFEQKAYVPDGLRGVVTVEQARQRWAALRRFARAHGHLLVTNGPYRLGKWSADTVVLSVFRDLSYPLGVGTYDRYAMPLRAWPTRIERRGDRLEIEADVEKLTKSERSYKLLREPYRPEPAGERLRMPILAARYVVIGGTDEIVAAGASEELDGAKLVVDLKGRLKAGVYRVAVALALDDNVVNPEIKVTSYRVTD